MPETYIPIGKLKEHRDKQNFFFFLISYTETNRIQKGNHKRQTEFKREIIKQLVCEINGKRKM